MSRVLCEGKNHMAIAAEKGCVMTFPIRRDNLVNRCQNLWVENDIAIPDRVGVVSFVRPNVMNVVMNLFSLNVAGRAQGERVDDGSEMAVANHYDGFFFHLRASPS